MRKYLVKLAYLAKGVLESVLGDVRQPNGHEQVVVYGGRGSGKTFGTWAAYQEWIREDSLRGQRDDVANGNTQH